MATYKRQLRDKDGNTIYPDVGLELDDVIYGSDPGEVSAPVAWIETTDIKDGQITTDKIASSAITGAKIDWTSNGGVIKTITDQNGARTGVYFADGTMICYRVVSGDTPITTAVGSLYYADVPSTSYWALAPAPATGAVDFISSPVINVSVLASSTQYMWAGTGAAGPINTSGTGNRWSLPTNAVRLFRATSHNDAFYAINIIAIGRWKA